MRASIRWATQTASDWSTAIRLAAAMPGVDEFVNENIELLLLLEPHLDAVAPKEAAGFWLAMARSSSQSQIPRQRQVQAAERAAALYATLDQPKRYFRSLNRTALFRAESGDAIGAERAWAAARQVFVPHWPALLRARLINVSAHVHSGPGRNDQALPLFGEALAIDSSAGDWRPEVRGRSNFADMLWQLGRTLEACDQWLDLAAKLRRRGSTAKGTSMTLTNLAGVLSELDRSTEATEVAREALPFMLRSGNLRVLAESLVYLMVQRGQPMTAARLIGVSEGAHARLGSGPQANEERLMTKARARLAIELDTTAFARLVAEGTKLDDAAVYATVEAALAVQGHDPQ